MKIKQVVEKEIKEISLSLEKPQNVSVFLTSKSDYDFIGLELSDEDLELSMQFCEMLKKKIIENLAKDLF